MTTLIFVKGDATKPKGEGNKLIIHICNDIGKWGKGFVMAISKRWKQPEKEYRKLDTYYLGNVQFVSVTNNITVANMISQNGINKKGSKPICRVNYQSLKKCLIEINKYAVENDCSVHMPKIGCGLGGGDWNIIEDLIREHLDGLQVYVYNF